MGFLDNSGDIILDAVLTDNGRRILSKGNGSFRISKFALCDEEINYELYDSGHPSGSAYYDLEVLQTPVLEAFTNNASSMKTKLISIPDQNLLYLPILKINQNLVNTKMHSSGAFMIAVDRSTEGTDAAGTSKSVGYIGADQVQGILFGESFEDSNYIRVDQGLDTENAISPSNRAALGTMIENSYILQLDSRLGRVTDLVGTTIAPDYIDDDHIAFYTVDNSDNVVKENLDTSTTATQTISGPRGTMLTFKIAASIELNTSTYLFTELGSTWTMTNKNGAAQSVRYIDTLVRATGMSTGYSIDIPIRFIKTVI
tara:strand:- start:6683 stop:7624 length:942 start_codon:yes stop_codon:yes gene_type:complete